MSERISTDIASEWKYWRMRIFVTAWVTYMTYYIGRVNIGIAKPFILNEFTEIGVVDFSLVGTIFFAMYAIGQLVNGAVGEKFEARRFISL